MPYQITVTREFYGPRTVTEPLVDGMNAPEIFATRSAAESRIEELDATPYETAHNEAGRPEYRAVGLVDFAVSADGTFWGVWAAADEAGAIQAAADDVGTDGNTAGLTARPATGDEIGAPA